MMQKDRRSNGDPVTHGIAQQIVFPREQDIAPQSFVYVHLVIAGAHFDFALGKLSHPVARAR